MTCGLAYAGVFAGQPPALETRRLPTNTPTKSASLEGCQTLISSSPHGPSSGLSANFQGVQLGCRRRQTSLI